MSRRGHGERAFLFNKDLSCALGDVEREQWEIAINEYGGDVVAAAKSCGFVDVPRSAKALWGRSAEEALATYLRWQKKRRR